jgi:hypothetical protein
MKLVQTQGERANSNGRSAEDVIAAILMQRRYIPQRQYAIGLGIFETPIFTDFYLNDVPSFPQGLAIESKWQEVAGSVDEKLPYLVQNILECFPCPAIVIIHGGGFRPGAEQWLRRQVRGNLYGVFRLEEFLTWANHNL